MDTEGGAEGGAEVGAMAVVEQTAEERKVQKASQAIALLDGPLETLVQIKSDGW